MLAGLPFMACAIAFVLLAARLRQPDRVARFAGFPMTFSRLWMPAVLVLAVLGGHAIWPDFSILALIAVSPIALATAVLVARTGARAAARQIGTHLAYGLPGMVGELLLFLAAGILGAAMLGIHPVMAVAMITPWVATTSPDPQLLAMTFLFGWSLGTSASPLSGTHLVLQGRYGIPSLHAALRSWPYALAMYAIGSILLHAIDGLGPD